MARAIGRRIKQRQQHNWPGIIVALSAVAFVFALFPVLSQLSQSLPRNARFFEARHKIETLSGDTVRFQSENYQLVGFRTPATGASAQCRSERVVADKAERRLMQLLAEGEARLQKVHCACAPGTEGTQFCHNGRLCAVLTVSGINVGETLIAEGLAERFICRGDSCPRRRNWCS